MIVSLNKTHRRHETTPVLKLSLESKTYFNVLYHLNGSPFTNKVKPLVTIMVEPVERKSDLQ